jgi:acetate CoA/acetoacetate CoA-transferase alpha subunit
MIRAGGCGLGGVITPTGVGTLVEDSPYVQDKVNYNGVDYLVMKPLHADVALLGGTKVDKFGNVWFKGTTSNFQTVMAMAADKVIVEAEELVEIGDIEPENVRIPGILVDYIVVKEG